MGEYSPLVGLVRRRNCGQNPSGKSPTEVMIVAGRQLPCVASAIFRRDEKAPTSSRSSIRSMPGARLHTHARTCSGSPVHPETSSGSSIVATVGEEGSSRRNRQTSPTPGAAAASLASSCASPRRIDVTSVPSPAFTTISAAGSIRSLSTPAGSISKPRPPVAGGGSGMDQRPLSRIACSSPTTIEFPIMVAVDTLLATSGMRATVAHVFQSLKSRSRTSLTLDCIRSRYTRANTGPPASGRSATRCEQVVCVFPPSGGSPNWRPHIASNRTPPEGSSGTETDMIGAETLSPPTNTV